MLREALPLARPARIAIICYRATGSVRALARAIGEGAAREGAKVRLRHVAELSEELLVDQDWYRDRHRSPLEEPVARIADLEWADAIAFGAPTRLGSVALQRTSFIHLAGDLWGRGRLVDKVATAFTSSQTEHGGHESTILALHSALYHWGAVILPHGQTAPDIVDGDGTSAGASLTGARRAGVPSREELLAARAQGTQLARVGQVMRAARAAGLLSGATPGPLAAALRAGRTA